MGAVHVHRGAVDGADLGAQLPQDLKDQGYVADLRNIFNTADPVHQKGGGDDGNGGIFGPADFNSAAEGEPSLDLILGQIMHPL